MSAILLPAAIPEWKRMYPRPAEGDGFAVARFFRFMAQTRQKTREFQAFLAFVAKGLPAIDLALVPATTKEFQQMLELHQATLTEAREYHKTFMGFLLQGWIPVKQIHQNIELINTILADLEILQLMGAPAKERVRIGPTKRASLSEMTQRRMALMGDGDHEPDDEARAWLNADLNSYLNELD